MDPTTVVAASQPDALRAALAENAEELRTAGEHHHGGALTSVRTATHAGHQIEVETTYSITVDGERFDAGLIVDNEGRVYYHGLPTRDFASAIDLVKKAIDQFPDDFGPMKHDDHGPEHGHRADD
jgi:hypothetical protein